MAIRLSHNIKWFPETKKIKLSTKNTDNIFNLKGLDYQIKYLKGTKGSSGGNSNVFMLCDPDDPDNEAEQLAIKICNTPIEKSSEDYKKRFEREIIVLNIIRRKSKNKFIIEFVDAGSFIIDNYQFPFYIMEKCNNDLTNFCQDYELDISEKVALCYYIIQGFCDLHDLKIYHRDIKSDNFLMKNDVCKIGDLGLVDYRDIDSKLFINEEGKKIGAFGWESPEVMNKIMTEKYNANFDCKLDSSSDIFQLGKLFWFIMQGNLPIGLIKKEDFLVDDSELFDLICKMLDHKKGANRRPKDAIELKNIFQPLAKKYSII